jgi:hypothetical protein
MPSKKLNDPSMELILLDARIQFVICKSRLLQWTN